MTTSTGRPGLLWAKIEFDLHPGHTLDQQQADMCQTAFRRVVDGAGGAVHSVKFGERGLVQIVLGLPPHIVMSKTVNAMKTVSARSVSRSWTRGYHAESVTIPDESDHQR